MYQHKEGFLLLVVWTEYYFSYLMEKFEWSTATFDAAATWLFHPIPNSVTLSLCLSLHWQTRLNCKHSFLLVFSVLLKQSFCWGLFFPLK